MQFVEPVFTVEYEAPTGQIMLTAIYPGGCKHRTSMDRQTLMKLLSSGKEAYGKSVA